MPTLTLRSDQGESRTALMPDYLRTLAGPRDDMWGTFADQGASFALEANGQPVGFGALNDEGELVSFYVDPEHPGIVAALFDRVLGELEVESAIVHTLDPGFLGPCLDRGPTCEVVAILYERLNDVAPMAPLDLRRGRSDDLEACVAFSVAAQGGSFGGRAFLEPYLADRLERGEVWLHEVDGRILAQGECRRDPHHEGVSHLGMIVAAAQRGRGLGTQVLQALATGARERGEVTLCSTSPDNQAAQVAIRRAGFAPRHRVVRLRL